jgi:hypothetical protein
VRSSTFITSAIVGLSLCVHALPAPAQAIASSPIQFGVDGGLTIPLGTFGDFANTGWNAGALMTVAVPLVPLSFRLDGQWHQIPGVVARASDGEPSQQTNVRLIVATANAVYSFPSVLPARFYLIGGAGVYFGRASTTNFPPAESSTSFGLNGGVGVKLHLTGISTFVEARYHYIFHASNLLNAECTGCPNALHIIPISVGIIF